MKILTKPPTFAALGRDHFQDWLVATGLPGLQEYVRKANARYWTWENMRAHKPPGEISKEVAWMAIKASRMPNRKVLPLSPTNGEKFSYWVPDSVQAELHRIDMELGGQIGGPSREIGRDDRDRYIVRSLMEEAIASSQIEGAAVTRKVAKEMLKTGRTPHSVNEQMILNNYRTIRWLRENRSERLTAPLLFEIHRRITEDTLDDPLDVGRFRRADEDVRVFDDRDGVCIHKPPDADELGKRIEAMCAFANAADGAGDFVHPVVRAIIIHFWLAYDHPFVDGNGRTARAIFYWCMLNRSYWLFEYLSVSSIIVNAPAQYVMSFLNTETDEGDLTYFIYYNIQAIRRAREELSAYLETQRKRRQEMGGLLENFPGLNHRQRALLEHATRHADAIYSIESHRESHAVVYQTSRSDLLDLAKRGLLVSHKTGKRYEFSVPRNLNSRLGNVTRSTRIS